MVQEPICNVLKTITPAGVEATTPVGVKTTTHVQLQLSLEIKSWKIEKRFQCGNQNIDGDEREKLGQYVQVGSPVGVTDGGKLQNSDTRVLYVT